MNAKKRLKKTKCVLLVHVKLYWKWIGSHNSLNVIYWAIRSNKLKHYFSFNITIWFYCPVIYQRTWVDKQIRRFRTNLCSEIFSFRKKWLKISRTLIAFGYRVLRKLNTQIYLICSKYSMYRTCTVYTFKKKSITSIWA